MKYPEGAGVPQDIWQILFDRCWSCGHVLWDSNPFSRKAKCSKCFFETPYEEG